MYQIIENPEILSKSEIDKIFNGKWVYIVKARFTNSKSLIDGMPVIVADFPFEGNSDGIYEQYDVKDYIARYAYDLCTYEPFIPSVFAMEFLQ